eukprot:jgi/Mesvir1/24993/Mv16951-RA.1
MSKSNSNPSGGDVAMNNVIIQLVDSAGAAVGPQLDLPQNVTPEQLQNLLNSLLENEEKLPYAFYLGDLELVEELGAHLQAHEVSLESLLRITFRPQAVFHVRQVTRCSSTMTGHTEAVLSVAFSPDGKRLASGSGDATVRFWDLTTATPLHTGKGHTNWVLCTSWSPDGKYLVTGDMNGEVRLWDPETGVALGGALKGHRKWVTSVAWEPAHVVYPCDRFATSSKDFTVRIWSAATRQCTLVLGSHTQAVSCVKWGGDGLIYTSSRDTAINVWAADSGKLVRCLKGHAHWVNTLALSAEYALRTGPFHASKKRALVDTSDPVQMQAAALERYQEALGGGKERLVSGSDDFTIILWEPSTSKTPIARLTGHQQLINQVYFSPNGQWIASASFDKSVKLWDGITGKFIASLRGHVAPVYQLSWSADSRLLVSGSKDSTLKVWEVRTRKLKCDLPGHADEVFAVDWSPDGEFVASGGKDKVLKLWRH